MSRILNLPNKYPELGRIRTGHQEEGKKFPTALGRFRFTTQDLTYAKAVASIYGGELTEWNGQHEVFSEADSLDCLLPTDPIFAAYESWGKGGNQRRCDGVDCVVPVQDPEGGHLEEVPCVCLANSWEIGKQPACNVTVRLKVVLPRVPGFGIWMLTSGSIYAAMELPAQVSLIESIRRSQNVTIPCDLTLEHRTEKRTYEKFERSYFVPVLRVRESVERLMASMNPQPVPAPQVALPPRPSVPAGGPGLPRGGAPDDGGVKSGGSEPAPGDTVVDMTTKQQYARQPLIKMCEERGLSTAGSVADLIRRLKINGVDL